MGAGVTRFWAGGGPGGIGLVGLGFLEKCFYLDTTEKKKFKLHRNVDHLKRIFTTHRDQNICYVNWHLIKRYL